MNDGLAEKIIDHGGRLGEGGALLLELRDADFMGCLGSRVRFGDHTVLFGFGNVAPQDADMILEARDLFMVGIDDGFKMTDIREHFAAAIFMGFDFGAYLGDFLAQHRHAGAGLDTLIFGEVPHAIAGKLVKLLFDILPADVEIVDAARGFVQFGAAEPDALGCIGKLGCCQPRRESAVLLFLLEPFGGGGVIGLSCPPERLHFDKFFLAAGYRFASAAFLGKGSASELLKVRLVVLAAIGAGFAPARIPQKRLRAAQRPLTAFELILVLARGRLCIGKRVLR